MGLSVYLETSIPSYLVSRSSRDIVALAHQEITKRWWSDRRRLYEIYVSVVVLEEISQGDTGAAKQRMDCVQEFKVLQSSPDIERLAGFYHRGLHLPDKAGRDAVHLAFACHFGIDFLLTWNCAHIANAEIRKALTALNDPLNIVTPTICTPEELMGMEVVDP